MEMCTLMLEPDRCPKCGIRDAICVFDSKSCVEYHCKSCGCEWEAKITISIITLDDRYLHEMALQSMPEGGGS